MQLPCTIVCFGDSITRGYAPYLAEQTEAKYEDGVTIVNMGVNGETAGDGLRRVRDVLDIRPEVVALGFGMNDVLLSIPVKQFSDDIEKMLILFEQKSIRVVLNTISPSLDPEGDKERKEIAVFNEMLFALGRKYAVLVNDVRMFWCEHSESLSDCLLYEGCDFIHPNHVGHRLIAYGVYALMRRSFTKIVWQFNGENAYCNYACPYCYKPEQFHRGHHFMHTPEAWRESLLNLFRNRKLTFYLSFGEPTVARDFLNVIQMVESVPHWDVVVLTNFSKDLTPVYKRRICHEGRFALVASYHPTGAKLQPFIDRLLLARRYGLEVPVVYVMYPEQEHDFHNVYFPAFQKHLVFLHVRRFRGLYRGVHYPSAYDQDELHSMARYMDDLTIQYMLKDEISSGKLSFASCSYIGMSNNGDFWACPDWAGENLQLGNLFDGSARLSTGPIKLGGHFSDGTTDGIANLLETDMEELAGNHIISYARQTGYVFTNDSIIYPNINRDFNETPISVENIYEKSATEQ